MQAETEELARRVEALSAENIGLKSEINQLMENSKKLRLENATLSVIPTAPLRPLLLCSDHTLSL